MGLPASLARERAKRTGSVPEFAHLLYPGAARRRSDRLQALSGNVSLRNMLRPSFLKCTSDITAPAAVACQLAERENPLSHKPMYLEGFADCGLTSHCKHVLCAPTNHLIACIFITRFVIVLRLRPRPLPVHGSFLEELKCKAAEDSPPLCISQPHAAVWVKASACCNAGSNLQAARYWLASSGFQHVLLILHVLDPHQHDFQGPTNPGWYSPC